ncbi:MAG TPA: 23S rRNA (adenine(2503)-C(2))-methyltransferase RlmN [Thermoanaerobaculia bacterium]|nr:23S rRNA (adenine(2503)-C(2))-methyltransferase RlmN [Thermoanaerobaculia bacterium]
MTPPRETLGLSAASWDALALEWGLPRYRGRQVFDALHRRGARDYAAMRELPGDLRERLARELPIRLPEVTRREEASDGSIKYALRLADGALIEAVSMPGDSSRSAANEFTDARVLPNPKPKIQNPKSTGPMERFTVCLSSQTGCAVDCVFCVTGRLGGGRNLTAGEIVGQLDAVLDDAGRSSEGLRVVFMGMGEPFLNPDGVIGALEVLFEIVSPRRVTVSTSGITPAFERFAALPKRPNLAVSINAADEETRTAIMPITRSYPLAGLISAMRAWPLEPRRRILVEYVLIAGVNDSPEAAGKLARLLGGLRAKVNVIPLNEDPAYLPGLKRPAEESIDGFAKALADAGVTVTVRRSKGPDVAAACGQLKGRTEDPRGKFRV